MVETVNRFHHARDMALDALHEDLRKMITAANAALDALDLGTDDAFLNMAMRAAAGYFGNALADYEDAQRLSRIGRTDK